MGSVASTVDAKVRLIKKILHNNVKKFTLKLS